jgi:hypothetical protein
MTNKDVRTGRGAKGKKRQGQASPPTDKPLPPVVRVIQGMPVSLPRLRWMEN